jgi:hypothetical protein
MGCLLGLAQGLGVTGVAVPERISDPMLAIGPPKPRNRMGQMNRSLSQQGIQAVRASMFVSGKACSISNIDFMNIWSRVYEIPGVRP